MKTIERWPCGRWSLVNVVVALMCLLTVGCSGERKPVNEKPITPVSGVVTVDGEPFAGIRVKFHFKTPDASHRVFPKAFSDADGKIMPWTYRKDDGLPPGEYTVTFLDHSTATKTTRESERQDLFNGKYADPKTSEHTIKVPAAPEPFDLGTFALTR